MISKNKKSKKLVRESQLATEPSKMNTLEVGDIVYNTWGYGQTNQDWYVVNNVTKCYVTLRSIADKVTSMKGGPVVYRDMQGLSSPFIPVLFVENKPLLKLKWSVTHDKNTGSKDELHINFKFGWGYKWDGVTPQRTSWD